MKRVPPLLVLLTLLPLSAVAEPVDLGQRLELFVEGSLIEDEAGDIERVLIRPEPREVVLTCDAPWEGNTCAYFTIFEDRGRYRLYYRGWRHDPENRKQLHEAVVCYAESRDGVRFDKPGIGLVEWRGSPENNLIWKGVGSHNFTPFRDGNPRSPDEIRYRALARAGKRSGHKRGLLAFESPDGVAWTLSRDEPVITQGAFDSQNLAFWDAYRGEYRAYWRIFTDGYRAIRTATSQDFFTWENETDLTYPEDTPREHLYTNAVQPYFRAPHLFIGFPTRYLPKEGQRVEPILMASRDGVRFERWEEAVIPEDAPEDRAGNRSNYMAWGMVELPGKPGEISVYATESYFGKKPGRLRRFVYRTDGFVALRGGAEGGTVTTVPLRSRGNRLVLNYVVRSGGRLAVSVLGEGGEVVGQAEVGPGDAIASAVAWENEPDLSGPFRLRFFLRNADLYSYRFLPKSG